MPSWHSLQTHRPRSRISASVNRRRNRFLRWQWRGMRWWYVRNLPDLPHSSQWRSIRVLPVGTIHRTRRSEQSDSVDHDRKRVSTFRPSVEPRCGREGRPVEVSIGRFRSLNIAAGWKAGPTAVDLLSITYRVALSPPHCALARSLEKPRRPCVACLSSSRALPWN